MKWFFCCNCLLNNKSLLFKILESSGKYFWGYCFEAMKYMVESFVAAQHYFLEDDSGPFFSNEVCGCKYRAGCHGTFLEETVLFLCMVVTCYKYFEKGALLKSWLLT